MVIVRHALLFILLLPLAAQTAKDPMAEAGALLDAGRYPQAVEILKGLAEKQPDDVVVRFNLALAYSLADQDQEAIAGFRKVLELKADLYEAQSNLAQLLVKTKQFAAAEPLLAAAAEKKPTDAKIAFLRARCAAGLGQWEQAAPAFE
jgi:Flp pilus assembly protein TadD